MRKGKFKGMLAALLALTMILGCCVTAFAAETSAQDQADARSVSEEEEKEAEEADEQAKDAEAIDSTATEAESESDGKQEAIAQSAPVEETAAAAVDWDKAFQFYVDMEGTSMVKAGQTYQFKLGVSASVNPDYYSDLSSSNIEYEKLTVDWSYEGQYATVTQGAKATEASLAIAADAPENTKIGAIKAVLSSVTMNVDGVSHTYNFPDGAPYQVVEISTVTDWAWTKLQILGNRAVSPNEMLDLTLDFAGTLDGKQVSITGRDVQWEFISNPGGVQWGWQTDGYESHKIKVFVPENATPDADGNYAVLKCWVKRVTYELDGRNNTLLFEQGSDNTVYVPIGVNAPASEQPSQSAPAVSASAPASSQEHSEPEPPEPWKPVTAEDIRRYEAVGTDPVSFTQDEASAYGLVVENALQGSLCFDSFDAALGDYVIGRTYDIYPANEGKVYDMQDEVRFTLQIPEDILSPDRTYRMICVTKDGAPLILKDLDKDPATITVKTSAFYAYALVYKEPATR